MIFHFTAHQTPFCVPEHQPCVYIQYLGDITLTLGWRYLLALSTLPLALFLILSPKLLPESLMYLATTGQKDKVEEELKKV